MDRLRFTVQQTNEAYSIPVAVNAFVVCVCTRVLAPERTNRRFDLPLVIATLK